MLNHQSIVILFTLIAIFGLLAIGSALNVTLLSVTHTCTEAPNINCYPQPINKVEVQNAGLNISTDEPIKDCSSEGVSDKVSFTCYLNVEIFLAIIGGLSVVKPAVQNTYKRCKSRECIRWHIPVHAIFAVFYLFFLPALSRPSFTSRTPNKDQKTEQLFYFLFVQAP